MIAYSYDEKTFEYLGPVECQVDPLMSKVKQETIYMLPGFSTLLVPPEPGEKEVIVFDGEKWVSKEDHRQKRDSRGTIIDGSGTPFRYFGELAANDPHYTTAIGALPKGAIVMKGKAELPDYERATSDGSWALDKDMFITAWVALDPSLRNEVGYAKARSLLKGLPSAKRGEVIDAAYTVVSSFIQQKLDAFAQLRGYDSLQSAITYLNSTSEKFREEAEYCLALRDRVWTAANTMFSNAKAGTRELPATIAAIIEELEIPDHW